MTCKEIQRILMDQDELSERDDNNKLLTAHLENCPACQKFANDLRKIRLKIRDLNIMEPTQQLFETTLERCHQEIDRLNFPQATEHFNPDSTKFPDIIWILLPLTIILTISWMIPGLKELILNQNFTWTSIPILFVLFENFLMLLLAPLLLRWQKLRSILQMSFVNSF